MSPEICQHLSQRIREFTQFIATPEAVNFNDNQLWDYLSPQNQLFLTPVRQELRLHNACLNQVVRWQSHPYIPYLGLIGDSDYEHVVGMLKIGHQLRDMGLSSFNFDDIEMKIIFHDSGEIITDDMSVVHTHTLDTVIKEVKQIEPHCFTRLVLNQIKRTQPNIYQSIKESYLAYENRGKNLDDIESHLVKYIDTIQGNNFGISHIYSPTILSSEIDLSPSPFQLMSASIETENKLLPQILHSSKISDKDRQILIQSLSNHQLTNYGSEDSPYRQIYLSHRFESASF